MEAEVSTTRTCSSFLPEILRLKRRSLGSISESLFLPLRIPFKRVGKKAISDRLAVRAFESIEPTTLPR